MIEITVFENKKHLVKYASQYVPRQNETIIIDKVPYKIKYITWVIHEGRQYVIMTVEA